MSDDELMNKLGELVQLHRKHKDGNHHEIIEFLAENDDIPRFKDLSTTYLFLVDVVLKEENNE